MCVTVVNVEVCEVFTLQLFSNCAVCSTLSFCALLSYTCIVILWSGVAKRLGCRTVTYEPGVQSSDVTLAAQHIPGVVLESTRSESPCDEFLTDVGLALKLFFISC